MTACLFAMFNSLVCGLSVINLLKPLVFTGESDTPPKSRDRYEKTAAIVSQWHFGNIWDVNSKARKYLQTVCGLHDGTRTKMMNSEAPVDKTVYLSQYDMSLVQTAFIGGIVMYPKQFGIRSDGDDLEDYVYFWRWIGYLLGVDDDNNICRNSLEEARTICHEVEDVILYPALQSPPLHFHDMAKALTDGVNLLLCKIKLFTPESVITLCQDMAHKKRLYHSFLDKFRVLFYKLIINLLYYVSSFRNVFNTASMEFIKNIEKRIDGNDNGDDDIVVIEPANGCCA